MILNDVEAREIVGKALSLASADEVRVNLHGGRRCNTRFALNAVTTCGEADSLTVRVQACFGRRHAAATAGQADEASLRRAVERAEELARVAPEDPEHVPELGAQEYLLLDPWAQSTAEASADLRARAVLAAIEQGESSGMESSGYFEHSDGFSAVGNSAGLFAWSRGSGASFSVTMRTETGSGWASSNSRDIREVDCDAAIRLAAEKAQAAREAKPLDPGVYPVILEPRAVHDFLGNALWCLDAREADEGRSFFARPGGGNKIGQKVAGDEITLSSDPAHPAVTAMAFHDDGLPAAPQTWIDRGVVRQLVYSRYWAQKQGRQATGPPVNLVMAGGSGGVEDLIRRTDRAVLVTRFWYIRFVDPQTMLLTGLTRDGTFWVEDGQIRHGLRNFRFNESPVAVLNAVTGLSEPARVGTAFVPALAASGFTFSSASDSV